MSSGLNNGIDDSNITFELMHQRAKHHRSISQLIINIERSASMDLGIVNPSANIDGSATGANTAGAESAHDSGHASPNGIGGSGKAPTMIASSTPYHKNYTHQHDRTGAFMLNADGIADEEDNTAGADDDDVDDLSGCFSHLGATSPDSEYDEALGLPDSVTILSMGGERPILVERKPGDAAGGRGMHADSDSATGPAEDGAMPSTAIPFQTLYRPPVKFKSIQRKCFIPNVPIHVEIIDHERSITSHLLNPNLYDIRLTHGPFTWTIKKRYKHITALHHQLLVYRTSLNFPFPSRSHRERRQSFRNAYSASGSLKQRTTTSAAGVGAASAGNEAVLWSEDDEATATKPTDASRMDATVKSATGTLEMSTFRPAATATTPAARYNSIDVPDSSTAGNRADSPAYAANGTENMAQPTKTPKKKSPARKKGALPRFPNRPESLVPVEALPERIRALESYLNAMLNIRLYRNHHETVSFLEISQLSFVDGLGAAGKECMIMKRTGFTRPGQSGCNCMGCFHGACCVQCNLFCSGSWRQRWMFVRETFYGYLRPKDGSVRCVVLFDQGFDVSTGVYSTGMRNGFQVVSACRELVVKSWTRRKAKEWVAHLKAVAHGTARDFTCANPHGSFAPVRASTLAAWFVDGASYMSAVADALEAAREEIYICDWWLSPEIYMKRPAMDGDYWRLDRILKRKAEQGVRIFLLLYKEVELALGINSYYSKQRLVDLHENIRVFRHPDHARIGVFFWAHHEKIVAIDQTYAFVGGIDLCYGRWDDYQHRLTDMGNMTASCSLNERPWPMPNSSSSTLVVTKALQQQHDTKKHVAHVQIRLDEPDNRNHSNRLPQLEPGERLLIGRAAAAADASSSVVFSPGATSAPGTPDIAAALPENTKRNTPEMERKNMLGKIKDNMRERGKELMARITTDADVTSSPASPATMDALKSPTHDDWDDPVPFQAAQLHSADGQAKYWIGKDYVNFIIKDLTNLDAPYTDSVNRAVTPRLPWHDVGAMVAGTSARDVARHFIQRWNAIKLEKARENVTYPYLFPKTYTDCIPGDLSTLLPDVRMHRVTCQVLRSVASWSAGFVEQDTVEQSIHEAYVQTITKAQHYVYIENQFFISLDGMETAAIKNQIANALLRRIVRAHRERQTFRVYVVMPLLPAFEGDVGGTTGTALRAITHWNYASICRGKGSLVERLRAAGIADVGAYISFHSVRTSGVLMGQQPITELIYVHSKLMIVDDRVVICGSANINDRSMIGKRDSEIAVMLTDEVFERGCMNGQPFPTGAYAGQLRRFLFREHLGLIETPAAAAEATDGLTPTTATSSTTRSTTSSIRIKDPVIESFWNGIWRRTSNRNTRIYDEVFKCVPTNSVTSFAELKKWQEEPSMARTDPTRAINEMKRIQGNLVDLPFDFLWREVLTPPGTTKEGLIPTSVWT